jgi:ADP-ribose pyrophosphatase YjhB (NUDIX family)
MSDAPSVPQEDRCVLRTNEPAKGKWFVPGGLVRKYERLADAFARIVKTEIGLEVSIGDTTVAMCQYRHYWLSHN